MLIKVTGGDEILTHECRHISVTKLPNELQINLSTGVKLNLPRDGQRMFVMENGETVDTYRAPRLRAVPGIQTEGQR